MSPARFYFIRHGETDANKAGIIQGHLDTQLNRAGIAQAGVVAGVLKNVPLTEAWTSDLQRAVKTAEVILEGHPGIELLKTVKLRERSLGALQGKTFTEVDPSLLPDPSTETREAIDERILSWWDREVLEITSRPIPNNSERHEVLVVTHGGFIGSLVKKTLDTGRIVNIRGIPTKDLHFSVWNVSITIIDVGEDRKGDLVKYADMSHMKDWVVENGRVVEKNVDVVIERMIAVAA